MGRRTFVFGLLLLVTSCFTMCVYCDTADRGIKLDKACYKGLGDRINITVTAPDYNSSKNITEYVGIDVFTSEDPRGFRAYLHETDSNTGIFKGQLSFSLGQSDTSKKIIKVANGTRIFFKLDDMTSETVWQPYNAVIKLDRTSYGGLGAKPSITLTDYDLNLNTNIKEEVFVNARSVSDKKGIEIKLTEKTTNSGVFTGSFEFDSKKSDDNTGHLLVAYNDKIAVTYIDKSDPSGSEKEVLASAVWKSSTGVVRLNKSSYVGLYSTGTVSVTDQDLNLRPDYKDIARVRLTSKADPRGFIVLARETGTNTGAFSGSFKFSSSSTDSDKETLKVNPTDTVIATYIDERNADNKVNAINTASAGFQFSEAKIQTTAANDEGTGNMLEITVNEPDANMPKIRDRIIAKAGTHGSDEIALWLQETSINTGIFKTKLYFTEEKSDGRSLQVSYIDNINIKYVDNTLPQGGSKDIVKNIKWTYQGTMLKFDKESYTGYNSSAKITLINMDLNKQHDKIEYINVKVSAVNSSGIECKLKETNADSGEFTGTVILGRTMNRSKGILKVSSSDMIRASYAKKGDKNSTVECFAKWTPQDGQFTLDRKEYTGYSAPVKITVKDWDIAVDPAEKDTVKVTVRIEGSASYKSVTLTETYKNSGVFTGTVYINGSKGKTPSITLRPVDRLEIVYTDKDTSSGVEECRMAYAVWGGVSEAKLELDKENYLKYGTYMNIKLTDFDQNKSVSARDRVEVRVQAKNSRAKVEVTLTETGSNTGIFTGKLKFTDEASKYGTIRVKDEDEITVKFEDEEAKKEAEDRASFKAE